MRSIRPIDPPHEPHAQASVNQGVAITSGMSHQSRSQRDASASALPRQRFDCVELDVHTCSTRCRNKRTRTRSGACMLDTYILIAPTITSADVNTSPEAWAALGLEIATTARRTPTRDSANRHPCRQAASFLPCTRPPDFVASRRSSTVLCTVPRFFPTSDVTPV